MSREELCEMLVAVIKTSLADHISVAHGVHWMLYMAYLIHVECILSFKGFFIVLVACYIMV